MNMDPNESVQCGFLHNKPMQEKLWLGKSCCWGAKSWSETEIQTRVRALGFETDSSEWSKRAARYGKKTAGQQWVSEWVSDLDSPAYRVITHYQSTHSRAGPAQFLPRSSLVDHGNTHTVTARSRLSLLLTSFLFRRVLKISVVKLRPSDLTQISKIFVPKCSKNCTESESDGCFCRKRREAPGKSEKLENMFCL